MASQHDIDNTSAPNERAPLLAHEVQRRDSEPRSLSGESTSEANLKNRRHAWRWFGVLVAIILISVFVKGWIDSDEVNVSLGTPDIYIETLSHQGL